jgi:hypothetical protein
MTIGCPTGVFWEKRCLKKMETTASKVTRCPAIKILVLDERRKMVSLDAHLTTIAGEKESHGTSQTNSPKEKQKHHSAHFLKIILASKQNSTKTLVVLGKFVQFKGL